MEKVSGVNTTIHGVDYKMILKTGIRSLFFIKLITILRFGFY